jgi:hypothetical protein
MIQIEGILMARYIKLDEAISHLESRGFITIEGTLTVWRSRGEGPRSTYINGKIVYRQDDLNFFVVSKIFQAMDTRKRV